MSSAILAAILLSSFLVAEPANATTECKDYVFIAARGTNAPPKSPTATDADYESDPNHGMGPEAKFIYDHLVTKATGVKTFDYWGVRYPAINDAFNFPNVGQEHADYAASVATGGQNVYDHATAVHAACPNTRFVLFGYSQGAQVVALGINLLGPFVDSYVDAIVLLGDTQFNPKDHAADLWDYQPDHWGLFGHRPKWSTVTDVPVFSYCVSYDMACNSIQHFDGYKDGPDAWGVFGNDGVNKHGDYHNNTKLLTNAVNKVARVLSLSCESDTTTPTPHISGPTKLTVGMSYEFSGVGSITNECSPPASFAWSSSKNQIWDSSLNVRSLDGTPLDPGRLPASRSQGQDDPVGVDPGFFTQTFDEPGSYTVQTTVATEDGTETTSVDVEVATPPTEAPGAPSFSLSTSSEGLLTIDWSAGSGPTPDYYDILDGAGNIVESLSPAEVSPGRFEWQAAEAVPAGSGNYSIEAGNAVGVTAGELDLPATTASYSLQSTGAGGGELTVSGPMNPFLAALKAAGTDSLALTGSYDAELTTGSGDSIPFDMSASIAHIDLGADQWQLTLDLSDAVDGGGSSIADQLDAGVAVDLLASGHLSFTYGTRQIGVTIDGTESSTLVGSHQLVASTARYDFVPSTQASHPSVLTLTGAMDPTFQRLQNLYGWDPISMAGDYTAQLGAQSLTEFSMDGANANLILGSDEWTLTVDLSDRMDAAGQPVAESMESGLASQVLAGGDLAVKIAGLTSVFTIDGDTTVSQSVMIPSAEAVYKHRVTAHQATTGGTLTLKGTMVPHLAALRDNLGNSDPISVSGDYLSALTPNDDVDPISYPMQDANAKVTLGETQWQLVYNFGDDVDAAGHSVVDAFEHNFASSLLAGGTVTVELNGVLTTLAIDSNTVVSQTGDYIIDENASPPVGVNADSYSGNRGSDPTLDVLVNDSYDPTRFPAVNENPSDYDWTQATVTDVHTYIGNQEISNTGHVVVYWISDPSSEDTTKINWTLYGTIGDNSITTLRAFLQNGTMTFKVNGGATNSTTFNATAEEAEATYPTPHAPIFNSNLSDVQDWPIYDAAGLYFQPSNAIDWGVDGVGTFTITGSLPPGTQVTNGWNGPVLAGMATSLGDYSVTVTATNASGTNTHTYTMSVQPNTASDRFYVQSYPTRQSNGTYDVHLWDYSNYIYPNNTDITTWLPSAQESDIFYGTYSSTSFTAQDFTMYKADGTVIPTTGSFTVWMYSDRYSIRPGYIDIRSGDATIGDNSPETVSAIWHQAMKFTFKRTTDGALNTVWAPAFSPGYPIG